jgi:hypothetical protein
LDWALECIVDACVEDAKFAREGISGGDLGQTWGEECPTEVVVYFALVENQCAKVEYGNNDNCESKQEM